MFTELYRFIDLLFYSVVQGSILSLLALGLCILMGTTRLINIAHGDFMVLGIYLSYILYIWVSPSIPPLISILIDVLVFSALGAILYYAIVRPVIIKEPQNYVIPTLIAFFGISLIIQNSIAQLIGSDVRGFSYMDQRIDIYGFTLTLNRLVVFIFALISTIASYLFFNLTRLGTLMLSVVQDLELSRMLGIKVDKIFMISIIISLILAGISGSFYSIITGFEPYMGTRLTILAFFIVILGGIGNIVGTIVASYILSIINVLTNYFIGSWVSELLLFALIIAVLLVKPYGIFGIKVREV